MNGAKTLNQLLDETANHGPVTGTMADQYFAAEVQFLFSDPGMSEKNRRVAVYVSPVAEDRVEILFSERSYHLLPRSGRNLVLSAKPAIQGQLQLKLNWPHWKQERQVVVEQEFQPYRGSVIAAIKAAAQKIREAYFTNYREQMTYAPLEQMIYSQGIARLPGT